MASLSEEEKIVDLLNTLDELRDIGLDGILDLPTLVVCGEQSAGKSSMLQALSNISFPVSGNLCTRHPTRLRMRYGKDLLIRATISNRTQNRPRTKSQDEEIFNATTDNMEDISKILQIAAQKMGLGNGVNDKHFSDQVLNLDMTGPDLPNLCLVDLPGLFRVQDRKTQTTEDKKFVWDMVKSYVERDRVIVLAVIPAGANLVNSLCLEHLEEARISPQNIIGVLTKPDEKKGDLVKDWDPFLALRGDKFETNVSRWHVISNGAGRHSRDYKDFLKMLEERQEEEDKYFANPAWWNYGGEAEQRGISELKKLLLKQQYDLFSGSITGVTKQVSSILADLKRRVDASNAPTSTREGRQELQALLIKLQDQLEDSLADNNPHARHDQRFQLLENLSSLNADFVDKMTSELHDLTGRRDLSIPHSAYGDIPASSLHPLVCYATKLVKNSTRPTSIWNEHIVKKLYNLYTEKWADIIDEYAIKVSQAITQTIQAIFEVDPSAALPTELQMSLFEQLQDQISSDLEKLSGYSKDSSRKSKLELANDAFSVIKTAITNHVFSTMRETFSLDETRPDQDLIRALVSANAGFTEVRAALQNDENVAKGTARQAVACTLAQYIHDLKHLTETNLTRQRVLSMVENVCRTIIGNTFLSTVDDEWILAHFCNSAPSPETQAIHDQIEVLRNALDKLTVAKVPPSFNIPVFDNPPNLRHRLKPAALTSSPTLQSSSRTASRPSTPPQTSPKHKLSPNSMDIDTVSPVEGAPTPTPRKKFKTGLGNRRKLSKPNPAAADNEDEDNGRSE